MGLFVLPPTPTPLGKLLLSLCNAGRSRPVTFSRGCPRLFFVQPEFPFLSQPSLSRGRGQVSSLTRTALRVPVPQSIAQGTKAEPKR